MRSSALAVLLFLLSFQVNSSDLVFYTQEFAPFNYSENGDVKGPAKAVIETVCQAASLSCSFKALPWGRAQSDVKSGEAHGLFVIGWNEGRAKWLHYSPPLMTTEYGFFVHSDDLDKISSLDDFNSRTVGVFGPSNTSKSLEKLQKSLTSMKISMTADDIAGFKKLEAKRVDAVFSNREVGLDMVKKLGLKNVKYVMKQRELNYFIGLSKEFTDQELVDRFNGKFTELYETGEIPTVLKSFNMQPVGN